MLTLNAFNTLNDLLGDKAAWGDVSGIVKGRLLANGFVSAIDKKNATVTTKGVSAMAEYKMALVDPDQPIKTVKTTHEIDPNAGKPVTADYVAYLHKPREIIYNNVLRCNDLRIEYRPGFDDGFGMLAHVLINGGANPDADLLVVYRSGTPYERRYYFSSLTIASKLHDPANPSPLGAAAMDIRAKSEAVATAKASLSEYAYIALKNLADNPNSWTDVGARSKGVLVENGFVTVAHKNRAMISEMGRKAISDYAASLKVSQAA